MVGVIIKTRPSASCRALKIDFAQNGMAAAAATAAAAAKERRRFLPSPAPILLRGRGEPLIVYTIRRKGSGCRMTSQPTRTASMHLFNSHFSLFLGAPPHKTPMFLSHVSAASRDSQRYSLLNEVFFVNGYSEVRADAT